MQYNIMTRSLCRSLLFLISLIAMLLNTEQATAQVQLYIAEFNAGEVSRVNLTGSPLYTPSVFTSIASSNVNDILVDTSGNVIVSYRQGSNTFLRKFDASGAIIPSFGTGGTVDTGNGSGVFMNFALGGTFLVSESQGGPARLTRRDIATGALLNTFAVSTPSVVNVFNAAESSTGFVYATGGGTNQVIRYNADGSGEVAMTVMGTPINFIHGIELDSLGRMLVADASSNVLVRYTISGTTLTPDPTFGVGGYAATLGSFDPDFAIDPTNGRIYVSRFSDNDIYSLDANGLNGAVVVNTNLSGPYGIAIAPIPEPSITVLVVAFLVSCRIRSRAV
jgi:hypothetical protein